MRYDGNSTLRLLVAAVTLSTLTACVRLAPPRTVSDFCLLDQRIQIEPSPTKGADDLGNKWDSDTTVMDVLKHNAVIDKLCGH